MSRHSLGSASIPSRIRLHVAGAWMFLLHRLAGKAELSYIAAYRARHGRPSLMEDTNTRFDITAEGYKNIK
jgi:hypothetical protein